MFFVLEIKKKTCHLNKMKDELSCTSTSIPQQPYKSTSFKNITWAKCADKCQTSYKK